MNRKLMFVVAFATALAMEGCSTLRCAMFGDRAGWQETCTIGVSPDGGTGTEPCR